jgi:hypothetical protein
MSLYFIFGGNLMQTERSGFYRKMLYGELAYSSFVPAPLPPKPPIELSDEMLKLLGTAHHLLGKLDGISVTLLEKVDTKRRNRQFVYAKYLDILRKDTEI